MIFMWMGLAPMQLLQWVRMLHVCEDATVSDIDGSGSYAITTVGEDAICM